MSTILTSVLFRVLLPSALHRLLKSSLKACFDYWCPPTAISTTRKELGSGQLGVRSFGVT